MSLGSTIKSVFKSIPPIRWAVNKSKVTTLPGFNGVPVYDVVVFFAKQVQTIGMTERASAISFNFVMALPPAIMFLFTLIPFFPITKSFQTELFSLIKDVIPGDKNNYAIIHFLKDFINNPRNGLLSLGFLLALFFSSNAMMGIMRSFDKNYVGFKKRKGLQQRLVAIKITMLLYIFVLSSVLLLVAREAVLKYLGLNNSVVLSLINNFRWVVIILLFFSCISFIYKHAPSVHKKWKLINAGSVVATFLMLLMTFAFSWWVTNFSNYDRLYGSISTILIIMVLIFVNSLILLVGFELNVSIYSLKAQADDKVQLLSEEA